ncbi:hypothetical protein BZA70DRAFT_272470 [Myxozyma melibiosi]|uniref:Uncharacterized protein n=1 Tax=Myxozyma melibiosi TaxID=54550 RepID=A0ABR1FDQ7_9ASCO
MRILRFSHSAVGSRLRSRGSVSLGRYGLVGLSLRRSNYAARYLGTDANTDQTPDTALAPVHFNEIQYGLPPPLENEQISEKAVGDVSEKVRETSLASRFVETQKLGIAKSLDNEIDDEHGITSENYITREEALTRFRNLMREFNSAELEAFICDSISESQDGTPRFLKNPDLIWRIIVHVMGKHTHLEIRQELASQISPSTFSSLLSLTRTIRGHDRYQVTALVGDLFFLNDAGLVLTPDALKNYIIALGRTNRFAEAFKTWERFYPDGDFEDERKETWMELGIALYIDQGKLDLAAAAARRLQKLAGRLRPQMRTRFFVKLCELGRKKEAETVYSEMIDSFGIAERRLQDKAVIKEERKKLHWQLIKCSKAAIDAGYTVLSKTIVQDYEFLGGELEVDFAFVLVDRLSQNEVSRVFFKTGKSPRGNGVGASADVSGLKQALELAELFDDNSKASRKFYELAMRRFSSLGRLEETVSYFERVLHLGLKPSSRMIYYLLRMILWKGNYQDALDILETLEAVRAAELAGEPIDRSVLCSPAAEHYALFIKYHLIRRNDSVAADFLERLRLMKVKPTVAVFNGLMSDALHDHDYRRVFKVYDLICSLASENVFPDRHTFILLWDATSHIQRLRFRKMAGKKISDEQVQQLDRLPKISLQEMRRNLLMTIGNGSRDDDYVLYSHVFRSFLYSVDLATCLPLMEYCVQNQNIPLEDEIIDMFIRNSVQIILYVNRNKKHKRKELLTPAIPREYISHTLPPGKKKHPVDVLERILAGDLLEICYFRGRGVPSPITWEDLMRLVFLWLRKGISQANIDGLEKYMDELRTKLGLDSPTPL